MTLAYGRGIDDTLTWLSKFRPGDDLQYLNTFIVTTSLIKLSLTDRFINIVVKTALAFTTYCVRFSLFKYLI